MAIIVAASIGSRSGVAMRRRNFFIFLTKQAGQRIFLSASMLPKVGSFMGLDPIKFGVVRPYDEVAFGSHAYKERNSLTTIREKEFSLTAKTLFSRQ